MTFIVVASPSALTTDEKKKKKKRIYSSMCPRPNGVFIVGVMLGFWDVMTSIAS